MEIVIADTPVGGPIHTEIEDRGGELLSLSPSQMQMQMRRGRRNTETDA